MRRSLHFQTKLDHLLLFKTLLTDPSEFIINKILLFEKKELIALKNLNIKAEKPPNRNLEKPCQPSRLNKSD